MDLKKIKLVQKNLLISYRVSKQWRADVSNSVAIIAAVTENENALFLEKEGN